MLKAVVTSLLDLHADHPSVRAGGLPRASAVQGIHLSNRWQGRAVMLLFRPRDRRPWLVVKLDRFERYAHRLRQEHASLRALATRSAFDGRVPVAVGELDIPGTVGLVQSGLSGGPLTSRLRQRLRQREASWERDHDRVQWWLDHLAAWDPRPEKVDLALAEGLEQLTTAVGDGGTEMRRWLAARRDRAAEIGSVAVPQVRTHGDLAPGNLLLHRGRFLVVDWEGDLTHRSPLPEAAVFLHHYVRAVPLRSGRMPSRADAIERAFAVDDALGRFTRRRWDRMLVGYGLDPANADIVLLAVLGSLASGTAGTAHARRAHRMWARSSRHLVATLSSGTHPWPLAR